MKKLIIWFIISFGALLYVFECHSQPSTLGMRIGNNPGWYGHHYTDQDVHRLMLKAGNTSTRYFITLDQWRTYGFETFVQRIKDAYGMGFRNNTFALTAQFYTSYPDQDTVTFENPQGGRVRTMRPAGLYEPIFNSNGSINPDNRFAVYVADAIKHFGPYFEYWEIWNEPDITYNQGAADDPNFSHDPDSWWQREPQPWEMYNWVATVGDYVRLCEVGYKVIKKLRPSAKVATGGLGYAAFGYWFHKLGGGKWYDVLSFHAYPVYFLREWSNAAGKHIYQRHSDQAADKTIERAKQWQAVQGEFGIVRPVICTEINIPRWSPDSIYTSSDALQRNFTLKLIPQMLEARVGRTWLFVVGEVASPGNSANMFDFMGLYLDLTRATPGAEVMTEQGIACATLDKILRGAVVDERITQSLHVGNRTDGVAFRSPTGKKILVLWAKTMFDLDESAAWPYSLPPGFTQSFWLYRWDYSKTGTVTTAGLTFTLSADPIFLVEK